MSGRTVASLDLIVSGFVLAPNDTETCPEATVNAISCRGRVVPPIESIVFR